MSGVRPMHEWFHQHISTATFGPGMGEIGKPTHLDIRDSFREMVADIKILKKAQEEKGIMSGIVGHLGYEYRFDFLVNESGSNYYEDYKPTTIEKAIPALKKLMQKRIRIVQIMLQRSWMEIIFSYAGKRYRVAMVLLYTPLEKERLYRKLL